MRTISFSSLRDELQDLKDKLSLQALKSGTEIEHMNFEELDLLRQLSLGIVPLYVKIGGAEARNDIQTLAQIKVDGLIAPMIESVYALEKFIQSLRDVLAENEYQKMKKGINIETITALENLEKIMSHEYIKELNQLTAARADLSASLGATVSANDPQVFQYCKEIVQSARVRGLETSVGGKIEGHTVQRIISEIQPDFINTRHMLVSIKRLKTNLKHNPSEIITRHLSFECSLYSYLATIFSAKKSYYEERIASIRKRIERKQIEIPYAIK